MRFLRRFWRPRLTYRDAVLATNPVAYWRLGEASGSVARDEMGANHGTYVNAPTLGVAGLLAGDPDTAVTTSTSAQHMDVTLAGSAVWTLAMVAKAGSGGSPGEDILFRAADLCFYVTRPTATNLIQFYSGGWNYTGIVSDATSPASLVFTYDGSNLLAYANGVLAFGPVAGVALSAGGALFGSNADNDVRTQTIDEPAIWNRALTAAEIAELYRVGQGY